MSDKNILINISSKYVLDHIFDYLKDGFKFNLLAYSKLFQKKLDIELFDYQKLYLKKLNIKLSDYFSLYSSIYGYTTNFFSEKSYFSLRKELEFALKGININDFIQKYNTRFFEKFNIGLKNSGKFNFIDINSPFFYPLSLTETFGDLYIIPLETKSLELYELKNDYIKALKKLESSNSKYFSIHFCYLNINDINHLNSFKNLFKKIKYLEIKPHKDSRIENHEPILQRLFSFEDFANNLLNLRIDFGTIKVEQNILNGLNNFKKLEELILGGFKIKGNFTLKLNKLKLLSLTNCINFILEENSCLNLKNLNLAMCLIHKSNSLLKLPNIEEMKLENNNYKIKYNTIFDFSSLVNLKRLYCDINDFMNIEKSKLEILKMRVFNSIPFETEKLMLEKFISIHTLKEIQFWLLNLNNDDIEKIKEINNSVNKISILNNNDNLDFCLYNLQNKFPNLYDVSIDASHTLRYGGLELEIKENKKSKVKKISITARRGKQIKLYCIPYNYLESLYFYFQDNVKNFENIIGIFNKDNKVVFESMKSFYLCCEFYLELKYIEIICDNIDYMPNLEEFTLICCNSDMTEDLFIIFITKLLASNLVSINLEIEKSNSNYRYKEYFSIEDLKNIFPNINKLESKKIIIRKYSFK